MDEVYRNLWFAVLKQAIEDVAKYPDEIISESATSWLENECEEIGSFQWVCRILNLNPESIKIFVNQVTCERSSTAINNSLNEFCFQ